MDAHILRTRVLFAFGALGLLVGTFDPLEGAPLILAGTAAIALAAYLRRSRNRALLGAALLLVAIGVAVLFGASAVGGFGGRTGRSMWWTLLLLPYGAGWLLAVVGAVREAADQFRTRRVQSA